MKYLLKCTLLALSVVCGALAWVLGAALGTLYRALPLIVVVIFAVWFLSGCVYQPIHVELYNAVNVQDADIGLDASRVTTQDTYHEPR